MNIRGKLTNPFALVGQGFLAGAILFYSTVPEAPAPQPPQTRAAPEIAAI